MTPDQTEAVREALAALSDGSVCAFWACPGPDEPPQDMLTCAPCRAVYGLRQAFPDLTEKGP